MPQDNLFEFTDADFQELDDQDLATLHATL